ncbi:MAG: GNAT family N-acetyltransferase [Proteobacteria bacterium]|nr:GNAT family N-acetyltransferase [Pseudomonadota bacterium]
MSIIQVHTQEHIDEVRALFREYERFLDTDLCFQSFEEELSNLPGEYASPDGVLLLGLQEKKAAGCGALRKLGKEVCEMKRLFVRQEFRGLGLGKMLAKKLIEEAVRLGYATIRLDTLERLKAAIAIYELLGFEQTEPYYRNPLPSVVYWKLDLRQSTGQ